MEETLMDSAQRYFVMGEQHI